MHKIIAKIESINEVKRKPIKISQDSLLGCGLKNIQLHDHQVEGVRWLAERQCRGHGCILGDEMGLGKTCQTISLLLYLKGSGQSNGPHLILSPLSVLDNWADEFERFAPGFTVVKYIGAKDDRPTIQEKIRKNPLLNAVITTYEMALKDEAFLRSLPWFCLVIDEGHRLKNSESLLYKILVDFEAEFRLLLTGTPVQNNLNELYSLLSFVAHKIFRPNLTEAFVKKYRTLCDGSEDAAKLHDILRPFLLRRLKTDVLKNLPVKTEVVLYHGLSALQKRQYKAILTRDNSVFENGSPVSLMNIVAQLRKCVSHPYLFDGVEPEPFELGEHLVTSSGKLMLLDKLLIFLKANGHKVLVFSQMTRSLDVIQDYLALRGYTYERLDGSVRGEERHLAVRSFNQDAGTFIFLLSTKAGGVGLNLVGADTVIFFDSDFNPQNDLQAAARAHRIGQKRNVKVIRLVGKSTLEEIIIERAQKKLELSHSVIEAGKFTTEQNKNNAESLSAILKFGVDTLFENDDATIEDVDFEEMLGRSKKGNWLKQEVKQPTDEDTPSTSDAQNLYVFEGKDYKQEPSAEDIKKFEDLMSEKAVAVETESAESRSLRKHKAEVNWLQKLPDERQTRKPLSAQELAERQKKREETMARKAKEMAEKEEKKAEMKRKKKEALWENHHYESLNIQINEEDEEDEEEEEEDGEDLRYVLGDVTHPQEDKCNAIVIHCADDSGAWGSGGLFSALDARSMKPEEAYTLAGQMQDLTLGDVHLISIDDVKPRGGGHDYLALVVAQHRDKRSGLTGIKLSALEEALKKIYQCAKEKKASVHLPRIGHNTPDFNWYGTERLLRKLLASRGVPTFIYYYARSAAPQKRTRRIISSESEESDAEEEKPSCSKKIRLCTKAVSDMPKFMEGLKVHFDGSVNADLRKKLSRYVVAYGGDLHLTLKSDTSHLIVPPGNSPSVDELNQNVVIATSNWLQKCVRLESLAPIKKTPIQSHS